MEEILEDYISSEDLKQYEAVYHKKLQEGQVSPKEQFDYAWCLIRSKYPTDIRRGVVLLEAIGHTKLKDYNRALNLLSKFLSIEPANRQAQSLQKYVKEKMRKEGLLGMAIVGGAALAIGSVVGIGMA
ncbi:mitochondrial fission 1 protein, partial [Caerostris extrusa]